MNRKSSLIGFRVKLGGIVGVVGENRLLVFKARGSHREAHFEGNIDHWHSEELRLTDGSLDSHQMGVSISRTSHASFNEFTE
jgi:hypothetical protein